MAFDTTLERLVREMRTQMRHAGGIGIAAPQIGVSRQVFLVEWEELEFVAVNPTIKLAGPVEYEVEGCLSLSRKAFLVPRHTHVLLSAFDEHGAGFERHFDGFPARIVQHEFDHLSGLLIADRGAILHS